MNRWGIVVPLNLQSRSRLTLAIKVALFAEHGYLSTEE